MIEIHTFHEALEYITAYGKYPEYKLQKNIYHAIKVLGFPDKNFKSIHITGTNGKGSVVKMVYQALREAGYNVGCFISPHMDDVRERFVVNDIWIDDGLFVLFSKRIFSLGLDLSWFEKITLMGMMYFAEKKVDYAVVEVGVGAKNDATNFLFPEISAITSLGLDHANTLGDTLESIAEHKAAIIKPSTPVVLGVYHPIFERFAKQLQAPIIYPMEERETNMIGEYQKKNAGIAYEICKYLGVNEATILKGLQKVKHRGRLEFVQKNLLVDGAHNVEGILGLKNYVDSIRHNYSDIYLCFALKKHKIPSLVSDIFGKREKYIIVGYQHILLAGVDELRVQMEGEGIESLVWSVEKIQKEAQKNPKNLYVVFGSLYMIGQFLKN